MSKSDTALLVIDAQESFRHRPYWSDRDVPFFVDRLQALINGAKAGALPVVQVFHVEEAGAFSLASSHVKTFAGIAIQPDAIFNKRSPSALIGSGLSVWPLTLGNLRLSAQALRRRTR